MKSNRNYEEWFRRWGFRRQRQEYAQEALEVAESLQPVVVVDDVRELSMRPVLRRFAFGQTIPGVVAQDGTVLLRPVKYPLEIESFQCTFASSTIHFGVNTLPEALVLANTAFEPAMLEGVNVNVQEPQDAVLTWGTHPQTLQVADGPLVTSGRLMVFDPPILVVPGEYFFLQHTGTNIALVVEHLIWRQRPARWDHLTTAPVRP